MSGSRPKREHRDLLARLPGWAWDGFTNGGHARLRHAETGAVLFVPSSGSDHRGTLNAVAAARRVLEAARKRQEGRP